ncbi:hypothetical protein MMC13_001262 [Lambiella insularis]|nr:hypothetical protein [Lambiella insularis]
MTEASENWPGERDPTRLEVEKAHEVPESTFLDDFKQALVARDIAKDYQRAFPQELVVTPYQNTDDRQIAYPLVLLSDFPQLPDEEVLGALQALFPAISETLMFLRLMPMPNASGELIPPYLQLSMACLASCLPMASACSPIDLELSSLGQGNASMRLFFAATKMWGVMLEVDNREARKVEAVLASTLLVTYGVLSADKTVWSETSSLLGFTGAIARRIHLHDFGAQSDALTAPPVRSIGVRSPTRSLLMSYLFFVDVIHAVHFNTTAQFSSSELFIAMPASHHDFHDIYSALVLGEHPLPLVMTDQEDAVLILAAIISDIMTIHRAFERIHLQSPNDSALWPSVDKNTHWLTGSFVPFSASNEYQRMLSQISNILNRWSERFKERMHQDVMALFYFCRMYSSCPHLLRLPRISGYEPAADPSAYLSRPEGQDDTVSEGAIRYAWLVLENINVTGDGPRVACPIWLPVVTFLAALVVWRSLKSSSLVKPGFGTLKVLGVFRAELEQMPWSCCTQMVKTLVKLMRG